MRLVVPLCVVLASGEGLAASAATRAKAIALEGKKAFDTGDFATAIQRYEDAYKLKAAPALLFNLGQCHRKLGHFDEALSFFRRYLESNPPAAQARATEQVMRELEAQRHAEEEAAREEEARRLAAEEAQRQAKADELRIAAARAEADAAARKLSLELTQREAPASARPEPLTSKWYVWAGAAAVVIGGAAATAAVLSAPRPAQTSFQDINAR